ncbi:MAG: hypothetical protein RDA78_24395 [Roseibium sp.]|uniref:hypothetical protein n=1 Tax=Roseibium sp. TaxID=1936156 RepID=UPI003D9C1536
MFYSIEQDTIYYIALTRWVPPLITILVGGLFASILFPRWQENYARNKAREQRKLEIYEEVARWTYRYGVFWDRLITISRLEKSKAGGLEDAEMERKKQFVEDRNEARLQLSDALCRAELYFSDETLRAVQRFRKWDEGLSKLYLNQLPSKEKFDEEIRIITRFLSRELIK